MTRRRPGVSEHQGLVYPYSLHIFSNNVPLSRRRPGVYEHQGIVYPKSLEISSSNVETKVEPDFSFKIPEDILLMLSIAYSEACITSEKDPRMIEIREAEIAKEKIKLAIVEDKLRSEQKEKKLTKTF